ncbi:MAG: hypothetical protein A2729_03615 [Candidatus Buchananbacteria bacterium RIFCSPHIGHO2_01_FULL_39_14]|uniref:CxxC-x17-CxxC domain-containing protein n=1 Tax=Candidatus Buchananbacteria bacterium RIFCSPHIGHO2_01_FULL_39_14 TaxID=1797532 RepID=A0A1G1XUT6_9BACT|nr:MAG: hypothetical protein A2729_03615 [Candidatus Buchananbacteria bacterium RIFCSPHIGHO2_01_FULL_39_14]
MAKLVCSTCAKNFEFEPFVPTPGKPMYCIDCTQEATSLSFWLKAVTDPAKKRKILNRIAALQNEKPKKRSF